MLTTGFSASEMARLSGCLARLLPHVRAGEIAITGGVAVQLGLAVLDRAGSRAVITDLDFVACRLEAVAGTVAGPFLVSHYHVPQPDAPKFMIQLVDPVSRIRIDIFPDLVDSLSNARTFAIGKQLVNVLDLQSILDHKLLTISKASTRRPIDPKHYLDARALGAIFGREVPAVPADALTEDVYGIEGDLQCRRCELSLSPSFPLAPKDQIFALLGWAWEQTGRRLPPAAANAS